MTIRRKSIALEPRLAPRKVSKCNLECAPNSKRIIFRFQRVTRPRWFSVIFTPELVVCSLIIIAGLYTAIFVIGKYIIKIIHYRYANTPSRRLIALRHKRPHRFPVNRDRAIDLCRILYYIVLYKILYIDVKYSLTFVTRA